MDRQTAVSENIDAFQRWGHRQTIKETGWRLGLVMALVLLSGVRLGMAVPGDLDPTFGIGGIAITFGPNDRASALVVQPNGQFIVAGTSFPGGADVTLPPSLGSSPEAVMLVRYQPDGRVDASFGQGGKLATSFGLGSGASALLQQPDGTLVMAGYAAVGIGNSGGVSNVRLIDVLLARYLPDGRLDAAFGAGGMVTTDFGGSDVATAVIRQPDGTLVVAGSSTLSPLRPIQMPFVARYWPDGSLDASFGIGGKVSSFFSPGQNNNGSVAAALVLQPDGKVVVAGSTGAPNPFAPTLSVARLKPDGTLDASFGAGGVVTTPIGSSSGATAVVLQPGGKLVVAGFTPGFGAADLLLVRYLPDGRLDASFGTGGMVTTPVGGGSGATALLQQPDGKLVVAGPVQPANVLLVRYLPDGRLDANFGTGGIVTTDLGGQEFASALLEQPDGKLVLAGSFSASGATDILLTRYQALGCPAVDPEPCRAQLAAFVTDVYRAAFGRLPDALEVAYWVDVLETEPAPDTARGMLQVVFDGPEFRQRPVNPWQYILALYQAILGREPDPAELDWWVQAVLDRQNTVLPEFLESPEFQRVVPDCQDQAALTLLVGRLYQQVLGRVASLEELVWWTADIVTWCALQDAVEVFFNSLEYLSEPRTLTEHVSVLYRALLAREPDAGGLTWWVDYLARQLMVLEDDFMASTEFDAHFFRLFP